MGYSTIQAVDFIMKNVKIIMNEQNAEQNLFVFSHSTNLNEFKSTLMWNQKIDGVNRTYKTKNSIMCIGAQGSTSRGDVQKFPGKAHTVFKL